MRTIFISAGDPSGDIHASRLMREMKILYKDIEFIGLGGKEMEKEGLQSLADFNEISIVGFWEVAQRYLFFINLLNKCKKILSERKISAFIPVDYPGFNIRLASYAKKIGIPVIYYIAPQLWAWGKNRAKHLSRCVDKLLVVLPFEVEIFQKYGISSEFVGHPLLDDPAFEIIPKSYDDRQSLIAFLPGSRQQEVKKHIPILADISKHILNKLPDYKIGLAKTPTVPIKIYEDIIKKNPSWELWDDSRELMKKAISGVIKTGTSTLEAAICGMPFIMYYKTSGITYFLGKKLINLPYISLVNILAKSTLISEFIQKDINPQNITEEILKMINNKDYYKYFQRQFDIIKNSLGQPGASKRAANIAIRYLL